MWLLSFSCFWWYARRYAGSLPDANWAKFQNDRIWIRVNIPGENRFCTKVVAWGESVRHVLSHSFILIHLVLHPF